MANYFNTLNLRQQLAQLGKCRFMARDEFADGASYLQGKKVVIVGCGAPTRGRNTLPCHCCKKKPGAQTILFGLRSGFLEGKKGL